MGSAQLSMSLPTSFPFTFAAPDNEEAPHSPPYLRYESPYQPSPPSNPPFQYWSSLSPTSELMMDVDDYSTLHWPCGHLPNSILPASAEQSTGYSDVHSRTSAAEDHELLNQQVLTGDGGDAVNAAFLQLMDSQIPGKKVDSFLIKLLLRRGSFPPEELLNLVDWRRLQGLAERLVNWMLDTTAASRQSKHRYPPNTVESIAVQSDIDHSCPYNPPSSLVLPSREAFFPPISANLISRCPSPRISTDNSLNQALTLSPSTPSRGPLFFKSASPPPAAVPPTPLPESLHADSHISPSSEKSPPAPDPVTPPTNISPTITISPPPSSIAPESPLPADSTPPSYPDIIQDSNIQVDSVHIIAPVTDTPLAPKRRCDHCQTENTAQWRTHPEKDGHLCNACGQYLLRQGKPRPLDTINQAKLRPPRTSCKDDFLVAPPRSVVPEKRGGEVIMRVFSKSARRHSHSGETLVAVDPVF
ncbi:hypothetical protein R3P38DRAFT_2933257 [Favolaschia claudopus]|uniref:GATA-type domain-containing protein n=1 Tax=Favolaschia claudopus TaxID=2862362 RepID=A0AAW0BY07_9AGAR